MKCQKFSLKCQENRLLHKLCTGNHFFLNKKVVGGSGGWGCGEVVGDLKILPATVLDGVLNFVLLKPDIPCLCIQ